MLPGVRAFLLLLVVAVVLVSCPFCGVSHECCDIQRPVCLWPKVVLALPYVLAALPLCVLSDEELDSCARVVIALLFVFDSI